MNPRTRFLAGSFAAVLVLIVAGVSFRAAQSQPGMAEVDTSKYVVQPATWVPFTHEGEFRQNGLPPGTRFVGYQSVDGSTRMESHNPTSVGVEVDNRSVGKHFSWKRRTAAPQSAPTGTVHPLRLLPHQGRPSTIISKDRAVEVSRTDERVRDLAAAYPQLTFWEFTNSRGERFVFCPELNLLPVHADLGDGREKRVTRVAFGVPTPSLFLPDPDVVLTPQADPQGAGTIDQLPSKARGGK